MDRRRRRAHPRHLGARGRTPIAIHEANARPGLANKVGARFTSYVGCAVPGAIDGARHIGMPLRPAIAHLDRSAARISGLVPVGEGRLGSGFLAGLERQTLAPEAFEVLVLVNQVASVALENATLYREVQRSYFSTIEALTSGTFEEVLDDLFIRRGLPEHIRSDNGSEFTAEAVRLWLSLLEVKPLYIEPGSPWENGSIESFHDKFRDE